MGLFDFSAKKETTKISVEILKGLVEKNAVLDSTKHLFAEFENVKEGVFIVEGASEKVWNMAKDKLPFELKPSPDFKTSYLIVFGNENKILAIDVVVSEGLEEEFAATMKNNNYILRIQK